MSVRIFIIFLLVMVGMALLRGPAFRRTIRRILGMPSSRRRPRG